MIFLYISRWIDRRFDDTENKLNMYNVCVQKKDFFFFSCSSPSLQRAKGYSVEFKQTFRNIVELSPKLNFNMNNTIHCIGSPIIAIKAEEPRWRKLSQSLDEDKI